MAKDTGENTLESVITEIQSKYGKHAIMRANDASYLRIKRIPFGIPALDFSLGGGSPVSRIMEIYGAESSGKTYLSMLAVVRYQQQFPKKQVFWLDLENALETTRLQSMGVDLSRLIISRPASAEVGLDEMLKMAPYMSLGVVDSVAALSATVETEAEMADQQMGVAPRVLNKFFRKWYPTVAPSRLQGPAPSLIMTNQIRERLVLYGKKETTTCGRGIRHFSIIRLGLVRGDPVVLKEDDAEGEPVVIGHDVKFKVEKNHTFAPNKTGKFLLCLRSYDVGGYKLQAQGTDWPGEILRYAVHYGVVKKAGTTYTYGEHKLGIGKMAAQAWLFECQEYVDEIKSKVLKEIYKEHGLEIPEDGKKDGKGCVKRFKGKSAAG